MSGHLFITQHLYNEVMAFADYLENHSMKLLKLINEMDFDDPDDWGRRAYYLKKLSAIYYQSKKIKNELSILITDQNELINSDDALKILFKGIGGDLVELSAISEEIMETAYYVDEKGTLRGKKY